MLAITLTHRQTTETIVGWLGLFAASSSRDAFQPEAATGEETLIRGTGRRSGLIKWGRSAKMTDKRRNRQEIRDVYKRMRKKLEAASVRRGAGGGAYG